MTAKNLTSLTCPQCGSPIENEMVVISDGYCRGYWIFCSHACCRRYRKKSLMEGYGLYSARLVDQLAEQIRRRPNWRISRYTTKILDKLVEEGRL